MEITLLDHNYAMATPVSPSFSRFLSYQGKKWQPWNQKMVFTQQTLVDSAGRFLMGLVPFILSGFPCEKPIVVNDNRCMPPVDFVVPQFNAGYELRDYQEAYLIECCTKARAIAKADPAAGKTLIIAALIATYQLPTLVLVPNNTVLQQMLTELRKILPGDPTDDTWIGTHKGVPRIMVSRAGSLKDAPDALLHSYPLLIADECFPAGTLIDDRPIETYAVGDAIWSFNHLRQRMEKNKIRRIFVSRPHSLVRLRLSDGASFFCTAGHPIFTGRVYEPAISLQPGQPLFSSCGDFNENTVDTLHHMWGGNAFTERQKTQLPKDGESLLFSKLSSSWGHSAYDSYGCQTGCCLYTNEKPQPNDKRGSTPENVRHASTQRAQTTCPPDGIMESTIEWVGDRSGDTHWYEKRERISEFVQDRHCRASMETGDRSGWSESPGLNTQGTGSEERGITPVSWVVSVEVCQQTSDGTFGGVCRDGFVYNFEVEGNHNYFANNYLVHNCHTCPSAIAMDVILRSNAPFRFGFTATPEGRSDNRDLVLQGLFGPIVELVDHKSLKEQGYHPQVNVTLCYAGWEGSYTYMEDLLIVQNVKRNDLIVDLALTLQKKGPLLILVQRREHGLLLQRRLLQAVYMDGDTKLEERGAVRDGVASGEIRVVIATNIFAQGLDIPQLSVGLNAAGGKSPIMIKQKLGRVKRVFEGQIKEWYDIYDDWTATTHRHAVERAGIYFHNADTLAYKGFPSKKEQHLVEWLRAGGGQEPKTQ